MTFGESAVFRVESVDDLSPLNFENRSYFGEKASGTSAVTCSDFSTRDLLPRGTLYQSCHSRVPRPHPPGHTHHEGGVWERDYVDPALVSSLRVFRGVRRGGGGGGGVQGVQVNPPFFKLIIFIAWLGMHV